MGRQALSPHLLSPVCVFPVSRPLPPLMDCWDLPTGPQERGLEAEWRPVPVIRGLGAPQALLGVPALAVGSWLLCVKTPQSPAAGALGALCLEPRAPEALRPAPAPRPWPHGPPRALAAPTPPPSQGVFFHTLWPVITERLAPPQPVPFLGRDSEVQGRCDEQSTPRGVAVCKGLCKPQGAHFFSWEPPPTRLPDPQRGQVTPE